MRKLRPKVGSVFWKHKQKFRVVTYTDDCTGKTPKELMLVKRWNKFRQAWVYEVWRMEEYFMVYLEYIKFERGTEYEDY